MICVYCGRKAVRRDGTLAKRALGYACIDFKACAKRAAATRAKRAKP